jgi:ketosteroid isomerase-like protein
VQLTLGSEFYGRLTRAMQEHDLVTLASLYHPDAVQLSADTGQVLRGTAAIVGAAENMLQAVGPIGTVSADTFVECGDVLCVEATQELRFQDVQTYDVFVLRAGAVQFQFGGMLAPRPAAPPQPVSVPPTPERRIYDRYRSAAAARDYARLRDLITADAVDIYASFGAARQGRDAILDAARHEEHRGSPPRLEAITCAVQAPGLIGVEAFITETAYLPGGGAFGLPGGPELDLHCYEFLVLRDEAIHCRVLGLISPSPDELEEILAQSMDEILYTQQLKGDMRRIVNENLRMTGRKLGGPWWVG